MSKQYVFHFEEAYGLSKNILGGKGAGLAEMTHIGVPIPQGFTISTEACNLYYDSGKMLQTFQLKKLKLQLKLLKQKPARILVEITTHY